LFKDYNNKKVGFIVEHDMMMAVSFGTEPTTKAIIFTDSMVNTGAGGGVERKFKACEPKTFSQGINKFLSLMNITFHTKTKSKHSRPRINKFNSLKDKEQKAKGVYYE
jgi:ATP-binding cassette subfamily E protein 1